MSDEFSVEMSSSILQLRMVLENHGYRGLRGCRGVYLSILWKEGWYNRLAHKFSSVDSMAVGLHRINYPPPFWVFSTTYAPNFRLIRSCVLPSSHTPHLRIVRILILYRIM